MTYPTFAETAHHLVGYHPPQDSDTADALGEIRDAYDALIDKVAAHVPEGSDATVAARAIHTACQACIAAVILNQSGLDEDA